MRPFLLSIPIFLLFSLSGCATFPYPYPSFERERGAFLLHTKEETLHFYEERNKKITSLCGEIQTRIFEGKRLQFSFSQTFYANPDVLNLETLSPLGHTLSLLRAEKGRFHYQNVATGETLEDNLSPENMEKIFGFPVHPKLLHRALLSIPVCEGKLKHMQFRNRGKAYLLGFEQDNHRRCEIMLDSKHAFPLHFAFEEKGEVWSVHYKNFAWIPSLEMGFPQNMRIFIPSKEPREIEIRFRNINLNCP